MKVIILAAGRGSRMGELTSQIPKCMVKFMGKPILEYTLQVLRNHKSINEIVLIRGYYAEKINYPNIKYYDIIQSHNMVETLFHAKEELNDDVLILYGDIIISENIISLLAESTHDISVCIDEYWKELQQLRFDNISDDLESCVIDNNGNIANIGEKNPKVENVMGQYFGAIKLNNKGCDIFKSFYEREKSKEGTHKNWMRGRDFNSIYMTDFLQGLIDDGNNIKAITCNKGWLEFDSERDLQCYHNLSISNILSEFIK
jgi:choline kinase